MFEHYILAKYFEIYENDRRFLHFFKELPALSYIEQEASEKVRFSYQREFHEL